MAGTLGGVKGKGNECFRWNSFRWKVTYPLALFCKVAILC